MGNRYLWTATLLALVSACSNDDKSGVVTDRQDILSSGGSTSATGGAEDVGNTGGKTSEPSDEATGGTPEPVTVGSKALPFVATVGGEALTCLASYPDVGLERSTIEVGDFRFYVHDLELVDEDGNRTPFVLDDDAAFQMRYTRADGTEGGLALLDFTRNEPGGCESRGTAEVHTVLTGEYEDIGASRLAFKLGVPPELNHLDGSVSPPPLNAYGMQWSWASGYRHLKIEVAATTGAKFKERYLFHPGAAGCQSVDGDISGGFECESPLNPQVELAFDPETQAIEVDLARFFGASDLSTGRGCMFANDLSDPAVDGPGVLPRTGCVEMWAALGLEITGPLASAEERMGTCVGQGAECKSDADCDAGVLCRGYVAEQVAEEPREVAQSFFLAVERGTVESETEQRPAVDELWPETLRGWPHPDYVRDEELDVGDMSLLNSDRSHGPEDERYGSNCTSCHQEFGPGKGRYALSGTVYAEDGSPFTEGGKVQLGVGKANRFGPKVHPIKDRIRNFEVLAEIPIDKYGEFYATADQMPAIDYESTNYLATIVGNVGTCKVPSSGEIMTDAAGEAVRCTAADDCATYTYDVPGVCQQADGTPITDGDSERTCATAEDCEQSEAVCAGALAAQPSECDKLLNAMPLETVGSCNYCHREGFKIRAVPGLF